MMIEAIAKRKSIRSFADKKVEPEKVENLLRAGMRAPSAMNGQPWEFVVVDDRAMLDKLKGFSPFARPLKSAPLAIVVMERENLRRKAMGISELSAHDLGACTQNILLQAVEENLGAVWLGVTKQEKVQQKLRSILQFPKSVSAFAVLAIGYPADGVDMSITDRFEPERIHYNGWMEREK